MAGDSFYSTKQWLATRMRVLARDRWCCVLCSASVRGKGKARVDHIQARQQFPSLEYTLTNLRTLCVTCDRREMSNRRQRPSETTIANRVAVGDDGYPIDSPWALASIAGAGGR
ncbi:HNHc domain containing protein [uncultured Caudovirales phage]|uniref:HNHc domain containing protein n=1 Tax=uncultured Caudovirales phage TaxID=2100421 RepID=A0A6J5LCE2_9CAUD|nr:HNHc domain containing protein [uncultured Caudovirales phage]